MTILAARSALLLLQVAIARDTVLVQSLPPMRTGLEQVFFLAAGLTSVLTLALLATLVLALFWMRRGAIAAGERLDALLEELRPMLDQATKTSESIRKTADLIQEEVASVHDGVHESTERVKKTVGQLADRVDDFNDLLGKVHARADAVVTVAGTAMDGIAWGAKKLRDRRTRRLKKT